MVLMGGMYLRYNLIVSPYHHDELIEVLPVPWCRFVSVFESLYCLSHD